MSFRRGLMGLGFAAALVGDWFMAGPGHCFAGGVAAFAAAHVFWMAANSRSWRFDGCLVACAAIPLALLFVFRVGLVVPDERLALMVAYALVSLVSLGVASGTRRLWYLVGISLLFASDVCIALRMAKIPHWQLAVGPTYLAAQACLVWSTVCDARECLVRTGARLSSRAVGIGGVLCAALFVAAALVAPEAYNPFMRMLSRLGRTLLAKEAYPLCHYLFTAGIFLAAAVVKGAYPGRGGLIMASGLFCIAAVPEDVNMLGHNVGCHLAALGGGILVLSRAYRGEGRLFAGVLLGVIAMFAGCLLAHAARLIPFAPAVPSLQKALIVSFAVWVLYDRFTMSSRAVLSQAESKCPAFAAK